LNYLFTHEDLSVFGLPVELTTIRKCFLMLSRKNFKRKKFPRLVFEQILRFVEKEIIQQERSRASSNVLKYFFAFHPDKFFSSDKTFFVSLCDCSSSTKERKNLFFCVYVKFVLQLQIFLCFGVLFSSI
jgi:hypothetical protein